MQGTMEDMSLEELMGELAAAQEEKSSVRISVSAMPSPPSPQHPKRVIQPRVWRQCCFVDAHVDLRGARQTTGQRRDNVPCLCTGAAV